MMNPTTVGRLLCLAFLLLDDADAFTSLGVMGSTHIVNIMEQHGRSAWRLTPLRSDASLSNTESQPYEQLGTPLMMNFQPISIDQNGAVGHRNNDDASRSQVAESIAVCQKARRDQHFVSPRVDVWTRRLVTKEDSFHLHKMFGTSYLVSSSVLLGTAVYSNLLGSPDMPGFLEPFLQVFALSGCVVSLSSVLLAGKHRRTDTTTRNYFWGAAFSNLFNVFVAVWASPFAPSLVMNDMVSRGVFATFAILGVAGVVDVLMTADTVIEGKRASYDPEHVTTLQYVSEYINYILPTLWGLPFFIAVGWLFSVEHDRQWYLDLCAVSAPGLMAQSVYVNVASSAANNWGVLAVTLRDKKLIGKNLEMFIISAASMAALLYNVVRLSEFYAAVQGAQM